MGGGTDGVDEVTVAQMPEAIHRYHAYSCCLILTTPGQAVQKTVKTDYPLFFVSFFITVLRFILVKSKTVRWLDYTSIDIIAPCEVVGVLVFLTDKIVHQDAPKQHSKMEAENLAP